MIDHIDGMLTFAAQICMEVFDIAVDNEKSIDSSVLLKQIIERYKMNFSSNEELLDVILTLLTIMSYQVCRR